MSIALLLVFMMPTNLDLLPDVTIETVRVSWYGEEFAGKPMASGENFDPACPETVAHKSLPFGSRVFFYNPETGASVLTEVKDRGPFVKGREFDLSEAGAEKLGFKDKGVIKLEAIILPPK